MTALPKSQLERRNNLIMEFHESGRTIRQIQKLLIQASFPKISPQRISQIINREIDEIKKQRREMGDNWFHAKLNQLDAIIRANWGILTAPCARCNGRGHMGQDPDRPEGVMLVCDRCHGDGKHFDARDRAMASKEIRQAIAEQNRMTGNYAPEKFALTDSEGKDISFHNELVSMDLDDLNREWAAVEAAMAASRGEQPESGG